MRIHVVTEPSWICRQLANHLRDLDGFQVRVTTEAPANADATYYLTYLFRQYYKPCGPSAALFTHYMPGKHQAGYDSAAKAVNHCVVLNDFHKAYLSARVGEAKVTRVHLPLLEAVTPRPLRVGWFHRSPPGYGNRKRTDLLEAVRKEPWCSLVTSDGRLTPAELEALMQSCDVFLTTSDYESGPMCLLEGLAREKCIVIPSGVGLADEYAHIPGVFTFAPGDAKSMLTCLRAVYEPLEKRRHAVARNTVAHWREDHAAIFRRLLS